MKKTKQIICYLAKEEVKEALLNWISTNSSISSKDLKHLHNHDFHYEFIYDMDVDTETLVMTCDEETDDV